MSTIRKRANGQYQARVRKKDFPDQTRTFTKKADAERWARATESAIEQRVFISTIESESTSFHAALKRYAEEVVPLKKGAAKEMGRIAALQKHSLAEQSLASIRSGDISSYRDERRKAGMSPATIVRELALISHVFTTCRIDWGMENLANPVALVKKPTIDNARSRRTTDEEVQAIVAESESTELPAVIAVALETAMRRSEILGLERKNVNAKRQVAFLPTTKNGTEREVPLSTLALNALQSLPARVNGKVFSLTPDAATRAFERARSRARANYEAHITDHHTGSEAELKKILAEDSFLQKLRFHDLRHEATTRLAKKLQVNELMKVTGHQDMNMLARYYHPDIAELAKRLG